MSKKLSFQEKSFINVQTRDYGLMRTDNEKSSTPYPRATKAVDGDTLHYRLINQRNKESDDWQKTDDDLDTVKSEKDLGINPSTGRLNRKTDLSDKHHVSLPVRKPSSTRSSLNHNLLSIGTPHPKKDIALNPKMLLARITEVNESPTEQKVQKLSLGPGNTVETSGKPHKYSSQKIAFKLNSMAANMTVSSNKRLTGWPTHERLKSAQSKESFQNTGSITSLKWTDIKAQVTNLKSILKNVSSNVQKKSLQHQKKVNLIIPRTSWKNKTLRTSNFELTFEERRRLFNEGEFSICKNGSPLNDHLMAVPTNASSLIDTEFSHCDLMALHDMKRIMRNRGFACSTGHRISI